MPTIFELAQDAQALNQLISEYAEAHDGDLTDIGDTVDNWLKESDSNIKDKFAAYLAVIDEQQAQVETRKGLAAPYLKKAEGILALAKVNENLVKSLKERLKDFMIATGTSKVETDEHKVWTQKAGGQRKLIIKADAPPPEEAVGFQKYEYDNEAIRKAVEAGEVDWAELAPQGTNLMIK